jgi:hypothetical protein
VKCEHCGKEFEAFKTYKALIDVLEYCPFCKQVRSSASTAKEGEQ